MTEYMTEQEQIEQIKKWLKENGLTILAGVVAALIIVSGWHFWQNRTIRILSHASAHYDEMLSYRNQNNANETTLQANKLISHYPKTPYAQMAALMLARDFVIKKEYPAATKQLEWVIDHSRNHAVRQIARIRAARIAITENKPQVALETLKKVDDESFTSLIAETQGDAYAAMHDEQNAKEAYKQAIQTLPAEIASARPILQMKLDNLNK